MTSGVGRGRLRGIADRTLEISELENRLSITNRKSLNQSTDDPSPGPPLRDTTRPELKRILRPQTGLRMTTVARRGKNAGGRSPPLRDCRPEGRCYKTPLTRPLARPPSPLGEGFVLF